MTEPLSDWGVISDHPAKIRFEIAIASPLNPSAGPGRAHPYLLSQRESRTITDHSRVPSPWTRRRTATAYPYSKRPIGISSIARDIPNNLRSFYNHIRDQKQCKNALATGFHSSDGDSGDFDYCGDYLEKYNIVYLQGRNGELVNLDIDCDGIQGGPADDGRCGSSGDTQSQTSFQEDLQSYGANQTDLDANVHPYVVFGNESEENKKGWPTFDPSAHGIEPLSIMAVVCNDQLYYGIWGDTNGDDGDEAMGTGGMALALSPTSTMVGKMKGSKFCEWQDVQHLLRLGYYEDAVGGGR
ncbi:Endo-chitosanase [Verticillium dahliae]